MSADFQKSCPLLFDCTIPLCCYLGRSEAAVATTAIMLIQASRFVNSFWLIFFGLSVVADLNLVPGLSGFLRAVAKRGKDDEGDDPAGKRRRPWWQVTVPHGWFTHFYVVGVLWNAVALFHSLIECAWAGSDPSVVGAALASTLFQAHVTRRLYESAFVSIHRPGGRMHVVGYLIGVVYYICVPLTLAHPLAAAAVVGITHAAEIRLLEQTPTTPRQRRRRRLRPTTNAAIAATSAPSATNNEHAR